MPAYDNWTNGTTYTFSTTPTAKLPTSYTLVKLTSQCVFEIAKQLSTEDLYAMWRVIYPNLPSGTPDSPETASWMVFKSSTGQTIVLAEEWINGATVVPVTYTQATVLVTDTSNADMMVLRDFMNRRKMKFEIKFN